MNTTTPTTAQAPCLPRATLSTATALLFHIAATSHTLAELFAIEHDPESLNGTNKLKLYNQPRPWLDKHPRNHEPETILYTFDPDKFAARLDQCSTGQRHMILWILNVWNPGYARSKGWTFDLFSALDSLDQSNREAISKWMERPIFP